MASKEKMKRKKTKSRRKEKEIRPEKGTARAVSYEERRL
jgi:hypothetical protein